MNLVELGQGVLALIDPTPSYGRSNIGFVIDPDGITVFDTGATPAAGATVRAEIIRLTAHLELPIKRVVMSTSRVAHSGGGNAFWASAFYGTEVTSDQLDAPPNPDAFARLLPDLADAYDEEFSNRPITHTVSEPAWLTASTYAIPLPGESAANLVLYMEAANVLFAGALASFGVTPLAYDGYPTSWIESLEQIIELGPTVVPGHGQPGGSLDLADQIAYLKACIAAKGDPAGLPAGPWDDWTDRRFDPVNVERAAGLALGREEPPQSMFALLGLV